jgi:hypothetical protein
MKCGRLLINFGFGLLFLPSIPLILLILWIDQISPFLVVAK